MKLGRKTWIRLGILVGGGVLFGWLLNHFDLITGFFWFLFGILYPFVIGFVLAFVLNIPMMAIEKHVFRGRGGRALRPLSFLVTTVLVLGLIALMLWLVIPLLWDTVMQLVNAMPGYIREVQRAAEPLAEYMPVIEEWLDNLNIDWRNLTTQLGAWLTSGAGNIVNSAIDVATGIVGGAFSLFIAIIFAIYLLLGKEKLLAQFKGLMLAYLPKRPCIRLFSLGRLTNRTFRGFVSGQCLQALIIAVIFTIVLYVGQFDYALLIAIVTGFASLIPIVGGFIGGIFGTLLILMSMGVWRALIFLVLFVVIQQVQANTLYNYVIGKSVDLPPVWVLVAVMVGGGLAGIFGMLFFIPLFSVVYTLLHRSAKRRLRKKGIASPVSELPGPAPKKPRRSLFGKKHDAPVPEPPPAAPDDGAQPAAPHAAPTPTAASGTPGGPDGAATPAPGGDGPPHGGA